MPLATRFFGPATIPPGVSPLRHPILSGPMAGAAGGALAAAVTRGGGLGFCGAGMWDAAQLAKEVNMARSAIGPTPAPGEVARYRVPIGAGLLVWRLAQLAEGKLPAHDEPPQTSPAHELVHALARARLASAWFSFGSPADTEAWVAYFRHWDSQFSPRAVDEPSRIILGISTAQEAEQALSLHPDGLALTGNEGGGHGLNASPPVSELLDQVKAVIAPLGSGAPLLFAAGGLATGQDAARLINQGADGVVFGTRYLLTPESSYSPIQKDLLLQAGTSVSPVQGYGPGGPTLRSYAFDFARKTTAWPPGVDGRGLRSKTADDFDPAYPEASSQCYDGNDPQRMITWAGTGVDRMHDVLPATELTLRLAREIATTSL